MSPESLSSVPPIFAGPLFAFAFFVIATSLGRRVMRWLRVPTAPLSRWEHGFLAAALGTGLLQLVPCALAALKLMTPMNVRIACGVVALALAIDAAHVLRAVVLELKRLRGFRPSSAQLVWLSLFGALMSVLLLRALVFRTMGDDDGYHLSAPKRWLTSGVLHYLPTLTHTNASLGFEMLYAIALSTYDVIGAKVLHYGSGLFTLGGLYLVGKRLGNPFAAVLTISLVLIETPILNLPVLFTVAYADFGAAWMAVASVLLWLIWRAEQQEKFIVLLALCAGLAGSFKFTSLALGLAWAPALIFVARQAGASWFDSLARVVRFGLISVLPVIPWLVRNALETGNPLYPMFSSIIPTRDWSAEHASVFGRYVRYYSWGVASGPELSELSRKLILLGTIVGIVAAGALCFWLLRRLELRVMLLFAVTFTVISVALTGMIFRYWMPAILTGALAILVSVTLRWSTSSWRYWPASLLLALALLKTNLRGAEPGRSLLGDAKLAAGVTSFAASYPDDAAWNMWRAINEHTPPNARLLAAAFYTTFGGSSFGGFWIDRPVYATDSHLQTYIRFNDWRSFLESVHRAGINYEIIFDEQGSATRHGFTFEAVQNEYPFCRRLADSYGKLEAHFGSFGLYRVDVERALAESASVSSAP
jgi:hypothetical protein